MFNLVFKNILGILLPRETGIPLIRIGGYSDGAYLLPDDLHGIRAAFSPGVENRKEFEDELTIKYDIRTHMCDYSSDPLEFRSSLISGSQTFIQKWLEPFTSKNSISLEKWIERNEPDININDDLLLQMDIEGAEFRNILCASQSCLSRFRIIILEVHYLNIYNTEYNNGARAFVRWICNVSLPSMAEFWMKFRILTRNALFPRLIDKIGRRIEPYLMEKMFKKISNTHVCAHIHANNCSGQFIDKATGINIPRVVEVTFLRKDRLKKSAESKYRENLNHPLDIHNVPSKPVIKLNEKWKQSQENV